MTENINKNKPSEELIEFANSLVGKDKSELQTVHDDLHELSKQQEPSQDTDSKFDFGDLAVSAARVVGVGAGFAVGAVGGLALGGPIGALVGVAVFSAARKEMREAGEVGVEEVEVENKHDIIAKILDDNKDVTVALEEVTQGIKPSGNHETHVARLEAEESKGAVNYHEK